MRKGITPIIAIIVLLLITVALAGAAWTYLSTYMSGLTGQSVEVRDYFCVGTDQAVILIANTGTIDIPTSDITIVDMNTGNPVTSGSWTAADGSTLPGDEIKVGEIGKWMSPDNYCTTPDSCVFRVIGGTARAQVARVIC
jgi:flagellin-like protein